MVKIIKEGRTKIAGVGSALVDLLIYEDDKYLKSLSDIKGGMTLVDNSFIESAIDKTQAEVKIVPGGAACNTILGVGKLGGDALFTGKCGDDEFGELFSMALKDGNVNTEIIKSESSTGKVLSVITPDSQRSMFTFLGAASELSPDDITPEIFKDAAVVMIEGYLLFNKDLMLKALDAATDAGAAIAMDLASFTVVEESLEFLKTDVIPRVDILIANEDEAKAYTGHTDEIDALNAIAENVNIGVLKIGKKGSYISVNGEIYKIPAMGDGKAVDTTGAGDLWASGFLFGMVNGYPVELCGKLASACGYEVCQVTGADIPDEGWKRIRSVLS